MLRKYAAAQVIAVAPADRLRAQAHRAVFNFVPRAGYLYVRSRSISSRCNDNFDYFGPDEIAKSYESFNGKPVFVNHNNHDHRRARGMVIASVLHRDRNPDGSPDVWAETLMEIDAKTYPRLAKAILDGEIDRTSMGCDVEISKCSVCGNEATTPLEYCTHIPGQKGKRIYRMAANGQREGVLVYEVCSGLKFFENSLLVEPPADPTAYFLGQPVMGPGLEHLQAKAASLRAVLDERPAGPPMAKPRQPVTPTYAPMQHTAAAGDDWSVGMDLERRRKAEEAGGKLWEGIHQIFDPGSTPGSRKSDRNSRVMNALQNNGYQPHHIKFDEDDDDHPYAHIEGNRGWYAKDHSGPHLEIMHHATGTEAHDLINLQHYDKETRSQHRAPGYGPHEAEQDLHHWTDGPEEETGGAAAYLEQHDPRIRGWQNRNRIGSLQAQGAKPTASDTWLEENKPSSDHIVAKFLHAKEHDPEAFHAGMNWYSDAHHVAKVIGEGDVSKAAGALGVYSAGTPVAPNYHYASRSIRHNIAVGGTSNPLKGDDSDFHGDPNANATQAAQVRRILDGEHHSQVLDSPKVSNYAHIIEHGDDPPGENGPGRVVVDRHAVSAAIGRRITEKEFTGLRLSVNDNKESVKDENGRVVKDENGKTVTQHADKFGHDMNARYKGFADTYREATDRLRAMGHDVKPHQVQAVAWTVQKRQNDSEDEAHVAANGPQAGNIKGRQTSQTRQRDAWEKHYKTQHGEAYLPEHPRRFWGKRMQRSAYGETKAPQDVDTLRDERCAICGNDTAYDGRECLVCGYLAPPKALGDPDVDKAKRLDELKQSVDDALLDVDPSRQGADFDPGDTDAIQAEELGEQGPSTLGCPACGTEFDSAPPTSEDALPGEEQEGPAEGDPCPACGKGILESTGAPEDVGEAEAEGLDEDGEPGDEQDAAEDEAEGGLPGEQDPDDPDATDVDTDEDDDEDEDEDPKKKRPASKRAATSKYQHPLKGIEMQKALAALAELQALVEYQQHENRKLATRLAAKDSQIQRLTYGLQAIAQHLGPEVDTIVRTAMFTKRADEQNPGQPIPEPAPEPAVQGTVDAETPEAMADVNQPGMVPGSTQDVAADSVSTAYTPGQDIGAPPVRNLVDVTRPIDGTQGPRPLSETKTNVDVRVGNPMNPQTAFPLGGPFAAPQRTGSVNGEGNGDAKAMASIRLARLRIATGEEGDDLALGQKIASELDLASINAEIGTLTGVLKRSAARQQAGAGAQPPRGAVPRRAPGVNRTVPSLTAQAGLRTTSTQRDDDADLALIFMSDQALSS